MTEAHDIHVNRDTAPPQVFASRQLEPIFAHAGYPDIFAFVIDEELAVHQDP